MKQKLTIEESIKIARDLFPDARIVGSGIGFVIATKMQTDKLAFISMGGDEVKALAALFDSARSIRFQYEDKKLDIHVLAPQEAEPGPIGIMSPGRMKTMARYRQECAERDRQITEQQNAENRTPHPYEISKGFDPDSEFYVRRELRKIIDWYEEKYRDYSIAGFSKFQQWKRLEEIAERTDFKLFDQEIHAPKARSSNTGGWISLEGNFKAHGNFIWILEDEIKDRLASMIMLSDGFLLSFHGMNVEIVFSVDDVFTAEA